MATMRTITPITMRAELVQMPALAIVLLKPECFAR